MTEIELTRLWISRLRVGDDLINDRLVVGVDRLDELALSLGGLVSVRFLRPPVFLPSAMDPTHASTFDGVDRATNGTTHSRRCARRSSQLSPAMAIGF